MTDTTTLERIPAAVLTEQDILILASEALQEHERLRAALRDSETRLRTLCRQYDAAARTTGFQPHHLRRACEARKLL